MLGRLMWYMATLGRVVVSRDAFFDTITGNSREKPKLCGYTEGLINKGFVGSYYYDDRVDSVSLGLTVIGGQVLREFDQELKVLAARYCDTNNYDLNSLLDCALPIPDRYTLRQPVAA